MEPTVLFVTKFLHLVGLMMGSAAGLGGMIVARRARSDGPSPALASMRMSMLRMGLGGIVVLWLSGLALWLFRYDMVDLGPAYHAKLGVAALLLIVTGAVFLTVRSALSRGAPPPAWVRTAGMTTPVLTLAAVGLAAWIFL